MNRDTDPAQQRPVAQLIVAIFELIARIILGVVWLLGLRPAQRARARAKRQALEDERASRKQQRQWLDAVERQQARGHAGFATEAEARAALRGRGGRPGKLDQMKF